jgi:hypothetical protein
MTTDSRRIALEPEFIESVEQPDGIHDTDGTANLLDPLETCIVTMASGKEHYIARPYRYVSGIIRKHWEGTDPEPPATHTSREGGAN